MSAAPSAAGPRRALRIRGTSYPVLLPTSRDPRLHLAAVIVSLQVLGQVAFEFRLSIAQILVCLVTCAVIEVTVAFRRSRVIMWPASALLTGNGVAFILRVPGTEHGDWWSMNGWWIFAGASAVGLGSKYVIKLRGHHIFNPSNIGLVLCFLLLGPLRAEPLDFWWSPLDPWMVLALGIIVAGGLAILTRLHLLVIAVSFWVAFAASLAVLAASGHAMTARWHLGPITGFEFWWLLVTSPEILVFLFFMITDPKTIPSTRNGRVVYAVSIGLLATLLIAPQHTEYASKVAVLGALAIVCAVRALLQLTPLELPVPRSRTLAGGGLVATAAVSGLIVVAGVPARPGETAAAKLATVGELPPIRILASKGVDSQLDERTAKQVAQAVVTGLRTRQRTQIRTAAGGTVSVPSYRFERMTVWLERGEGQGPPVIVVRCAGKKQLATYSGSPARLVTRGEPAVFGETIELHEEDGRFVITSIGGTRIDTAPAAPRVQATAGVLAAARTAFGGVRLTDVASERGLDFRQGAFRFGVTPDTPAMMGGGLCWLDYDGDGWLDLFVVNNFAESDIGVWDRRGGLPTSALFHNVHGRFLNVTGRTDAGLGVRGQGCVAADLNGDGHTDLFVSTASDDKLLWNDGDGTFTEGARSSGVVSFGWHSGAAVGDVNGDGRPDLYVAGYTEPNALIPGSMAGFPTNHLGVRDLLFLNEGDGPNGRARFREVGRRVGIDAAPFDHSLGAVFTDLNGDGRLDLYVANDEDPNRYYVNVPARGLGFRFVDRARSAGIADPNAGMGVADADWSGDGLPDLVVTNSRGQRHAAYRSDGRRFTDRRVAFASALGSDFTGWGVSWVDLDLDGRPELVLTDGAIPVTRLAKDAGEIRVLGNLRGRGLPFVEISDLVGASSAPRVNGRGLAAADFDNDGRVDVAINSVGGRLILLRNTGPSRHWLEVGLKTFAPGTTVTAILPDGRRLVRTVNAGSSYLSSEDPRVHFGLGDATSVSELSVRYPDGHTTRQAGVRADRIISVRP
jgi:Na+-translocating ferredoxin:NAD+ oxidoreductase RnfD subunit